MARRNILSKLLEDEAGATAVEYGLIVALIVIAMVGALNSFGTSAINMWNDIADKTSEAVSGG